MKIFSFKTCSSSETTRLGAVLLKEMASAGILKRGENFYVKLTGGPGAGKTTFIKGFVLNARRFSQLSGGGSPSFNILKIYEVRRKMSQGVIIYHLDLYRLKKGVPVLEFFEPVKGNGIWVIEWADKLPHRLLPVLKTLEVRFAYSKVADNTRIIKMKTGNPLLEKIFSKKKNNGLALASSSLLLL